MPSKLQNLFIGLLLVVLTVGGAVCSSTNAESRRKNSIAVDETEVSKTEYKSPKRVSKDVISSDKKADKAKQK